MIRAVLKWLLSWYDDTSVALLGREQKLVEGFMVLREDAIKAQEGNALAIGILINEQQKLAALIGRIAVDVQPNQAQGS